MSGMKEWAKRMVGIKTQKIPKNKIHCKRIKTKTKTFQLHIGLFDSCNVNRNRNGIDDMFNAV